MRLTKQALLAPVYNIYYDASTNHILYTSGPYLHIYTLDNQHITTIQIFDHHSIHGMLRTHDGEWIIYGDRTIHTYSSSEFSDPVVIPDLDDLILDVLKSEHMNGYVVGFAHNFFEIYDHEWSIRQRIYGSHACVLFSLSVVESDTQIICTSGTAFGDVFIGTIIIDEPFHYRLETPFKAHLGVVFRIRWRKDYQTFATTSDDRSVRLWESSTCRSLFVGWGHTCRTWDVCYIDDITLASCGEDGEVRIWDTLRSSCLCTLRGHGKNIWRVIFIQEVSVLVSGGNDGGLKLWDTQAMLDLSEDNPLQKTVLAMPSRLVSTSNRRCNGVSALRVSGGGNSAVLVMLDGVVWSVTLPASCNSAADWSLLRDLRRPVISADICFEGSHSLIGVCCSHPEGRLSCAVGNDDVVEWSTDSPRVISVWFFRCDGRKHQLVLSSAAMGRCFLWRIDEGRAVLLRTLVTAGEVIASTAMMVTSGTIVIGDTRGGISLFPDCTSTDCNQDEPFLPVQSFRRTHGGEVVSSLYECEGGFLSLGHDGYVNAFSITSNDNQYTRTNKLSCLPIKSPDQIFILGTDGELWFVGGYVGSSYTVYDIRQRYQLFSCEAGGWRRPHHLSLKYSDNGPPKPIFAFPVPHDKDHWLSIVSAGSNDAIMPFKTQIGVQISSLELNSACIFESLSRQVVAAGGEEGVLYVYDASNLTPDLLQTVEMPHAVPIKAVTSALSSCSEGEGVIIACGGRLTFSVWRFGAEASSASVKGILRMHSSGSTWDRATQDHRILTVSSCPIDEHCYFSAMGDSRGHVSFVVHMRETSQLRGEMRCGDFPILCSSLVVCHQSDYFLAIGDTQGNVSLWIVNTR